MLIVSGKGQLETGIQVHSVPEGLLLTGVTFLLLQGPKDAGRLAKGEPEGTEYDYESKIDFSVFPSLQGGPHNHQIAALAVALKHANTDEFRAYQRQVVANARALGEALKKRGYKLVTDGTDNHLLLWDLRGEGISGAKMEKACDEAHITLNKNAVVGDVSAMNPGGVRIGAFHDQTVMTLSGLSLHWQVVYA
eukprot:GHUV01039274.1.p1 GENE.GHUV01039274.1~~GHUV01039274.1.p1  ORF type:complete len:193 (-),score=46.08 GHUV01039274.1:187-765(-)